MISVEGGWRPVLAPECRITDTASSSACTFWAGVRTRPRRPLPDRRLRCPDRARASRQRAGPATRPSSLSHRDDGRAGRAQRASRQPAGGRQRPRCGRPRFKGFPRTSRPRRGGMVRVQHRDIETQILAITGQGSKVRPRHGTGVKHQSNPQATVSAHCSPASPLAAGPPDVPRADTDRIAP